MSEPTREDSMYDAMCNKYDMYLNSLSADELLGYFKWFGKQQLIEIIKEMYGNDGASDTDFEDERS